MQRKRRFPSPYGPLGVSIPGEPCRNTSTDLTLSPALTLTLQEHPNGSHGGFAFQLEDEKCYSPNTKSMKDSPGTVPRRRPNHHHVFFPVAEA